MDQYEISDCRYCHGPLEFAFTLGPQYLNAFPAEHEELPPKVPITVVRCSNCGLVQLQHDSPQELLYSGNYWYRSGVNQTMRDALRDITSQIEDIVSIEEGDILLDIGSNDGTLLRSYDSELGAKLVGVEPAKNLHKEGSVGLKTLIKDFWDFDTYWKAVKKPAKVITAIGMFYDLPSPAEFIMDIGLALAPDGIFVSQLMCLRQMLDQRDVGNLAHEHLEFYTLKNLEDMFNQFGMAIRRVETNEVNGGSYRIFATRIGSPIPLTSKDVYNYLEAREEEEGIDSIDNLKRFYNQIQQNAARCKSFIQRKVSQGKKVWVYGASTKGNTILQTFGIDHTLIEAAADRSPHKWGRRMVGSGIPIKSEDEARAANPDYFLVLPYSFMNEFVKRERDWLERGGQFIVPIPDFRLVGREVLQ